MSGLHGIPPFAMERFFARWEFSVQHGLCASDVEGWSLQELLALADDDARARWERLTLGYTESSGLPALRAEIALDYPALSADDVLVVAGAEEAILLAVHAMLAPGDHAVVVVPAYQSLHTGERFQVKSLTIAPGSRLSLQKHHHRAEHWVVVNGTALVTRGDEQIFVYENQSVYIPIGTVHRLENPGKVPLTIIEVQSGSYLGEDDIVRLEDSYGRN